MESHFSRIIKEEQCDSQDHEAMNIKAEPEDDDMEGNTESYFLKAMQGSRDIKTEPEDGYLQDMGSGKSSKKEDLDNEGLMEPFFVAIKSEPYLEERIIEDCEATESKEDCSSPESRFPVSEGSVNRIRELGNTLKFGGGREPLQGALNTQTCTVESSSVETQRVHTEERRYQCSRCEKSYMRKRHLANHMRLHDEEKTVRCTVCGKAFSLTCYLAVHMRSHTGEKPYSCSECKKMFTIKANLTAHMLSHTGEKPFKCTECGKSFSRRNILTGHMRIHSGEKPYMCKLCGKEFSGSNNLSQHMGTHTRERLFCCENCGRLFAANRSLLYHRRHVHGVPSSMH